MINLNPAALESAHQLLDILALAKDAEALKAALADIEDASLALDAKSADIASREAEVTAAQDAADQRLSAAESASAKADLDISRVAAGFAELERDRAAQREERGAFDLWMHEQREQLAAAQSEVASREAGVTSREEGLAAKAGAIDAEFAKADAAKAAADAVRVEYEAKLAKLRAMTE